MSDALQFDKWPIPFDPDTTGETYTFDISVDPGVTVTTAIVDIVDENSTAPVVGSLITSSAVAWGAISGTLQGVSWNPVGSAGAATPGQTTKYYARCRYSLSDGRTNLDFTMILMVRQR